jgi:hypothetical protein
MEFIITQWALDSYLALRCSGAFSATDYRQRIRPDTLLLKVYPSHPRFSSGKFWSAATRDKNPVAGGFKVNRPGLKARGLREKS